MSTEPSLLGPRFELGERIGAGSGSVVYEAFDRETERPVAVKLASSSRYDHDAVRRRFEREAASLAVIASPHVVELVAAGNAQDGRPYLVLERLRGRDLQDLLGEVGPLKPARVARFVEQAAAALELAHGLGIVHRDLKPANLFVHTPGERQVVIKVLDFGMVIDVDGPVDRDRDAFGGTPLYMAPEQVRGQLTRTGPATDVWALGLVTLTMLTGEAYWAGTTTDEILREIEAAPIEPPSRRWPWLPPAFDAWFARSTQRVPERRFRDVGEQAARLADALRHVKPPDRGGVAARTPTPSVVRRSAVGTSMIGRQPECGEVERLLAPGEVVTVTGTAGIGKTRLARVVCATLGDRFVDGAWFVPLAGGAADDVIPAAIAGALGLAPDSTRAALAHVEASLAGRHLLLALDAAEQVTGAAAVIERLRRACPAVSWLVTGRLPIGVAGERRLGLEPLDLPGDGPITPGEALTFPAIELFVHRGREVEPLFAVDDGNVDDVVAICRAVDGFPLGIELAAAQLATSRPARIRAALEARGRASGGGERGASVRDAVAWSYELLAPRDQALLRALAVLPAGLPFDAIRRRLGHVVDDVAGAVLRLAQSHLAAWTSDEPRRLTMLDTVRELCRERSRAAGEDATVWEIARVHAEEIAARPSGAAQDAWLDQVDAEHDNVRAVLAHLLAYDPPAAMRLASRLAWYWYLRGHYAEGARWLEDAIARGRKMADDDDLARAQLGAGRLALLTCRYARAEELLVRARDLARYCGDWPGEAEASNLLGSVARERGDYPRARAQHDRALALHEALADRRETARARNYAVFAAWLGDPRGVPGGVPRDWWHDAAERELRDLGDPEGIVWALLNRGAILHHAGDHAGARDALTRAFADAIASRFHEGIAWALDLLGRASLARGEHLQARAQLAAALRVHRRLGDQWRCASVLEAFAAVAVATGRVARGALYLGAADALRDALGVPIPACERALVTATARAGEAELGDAFRAGRARGRQTPLDDVVELADQIT